MATEKTPTPAPQTETCLVNGTEYDVLDTEDGLMTVRRPNGVKTYFAERLPDSPLYGGNRARMVSPLVVASRRARAIYRRD